MTSTLLERHTPTALMISDFDDLDAFDAKEDTPENLPYVFSPDAIREELARNMHEAEEEKVNSPFAKDPPFDNGEQNLSVSTLDIGSSDFPPETESEVSTTDSLNSPQFSQIHLSTSVEENVDHYVNESHWNGRAKAHSSASGIVRQGRPQTLDLKLESPCLPAVHVESPPQDSPGFPPASGSVLHSAMFTDASGSPSPTKSSFTVCSPTSDPEAGTSTSLPDMSLIPTAPPIALLTEKSFGHRAHRSVGPSAFEKVRSKTRPIFLPPKPRKEDDKHMSDWQKMMTQSRLVGECVSEICSFYESSLIPSS